MPNIRWRLALITTVHRALYRATGGRAAEIQLGARRLRVQAREAREIEAERLWPKLLASYPNFRGYRTSAKRHIPVVVLDPVASPTAKV
jgi:hypothetical protein